VLLAERYDTATASERLVLVDLLSRQCRAVGFQHAGVLEPQLAQFARPRPLRTKFTGITVDAQQRLALAGRRSQHWPLLLDRPTGRIIFPRLPQTEHSSRSVLPFVTASNVLSGMALQMAQWSDGSLAWLDPRGLLHLRSSWPDVPQCTIVLGERETAGWIADGRTWGARYFLGDEPTSSAEEAYEVLRYFAERLP
jgi:hypothetical protein